MANNPPKLTDPLAPLPELQEPSLSGGSRGPAGDRQMSQDEINTLKSDMNTEDFAKLPESEKTKFRIYLDEQEMAQDPKMQILVGDVLKSQDSDAEVNEATNAVANRLEEEDISEEKMMLGLVSPTEHKEIMKRTAQRKKQFNKADDIEKKSLREGTKQQNQMEQLLRQDKSMNNQEKRNEHKIFLDLLNKEHDKNIAPAKEIRKNLNSPFAERA